MTTIQARQPKQSTGCLNGFGNLISREGRKWWGTCRWWMHAFIWLPLLVTSAQSPVPVEMFDGFLSQQVERHNLVGLVVVIVNREGVVYQAGFGDVTPTSTLPIASLSKAFTATAVMQQVELGRIKLDAPVQTYLPWFNFEHITVRHLLNQVSGLGDAGYQPPSFSPETSLEAAVRDLVQMAKPVSPVGSDYHYFNPNYQTLGLIVEQVTGQPFSEYLQTHILTPLQMDGTTTMPPLMPDDLPPGHLTAFGFPIAAPETVYGQYMIPSGGIVSTAGDMAHFLLMQLNAGHFSDATIVSPESITLMHTPPSDIESPYAMGWKIGMSNSVPLLEHGGDLNTYHAQMVLLPEQGIGFVLMLNQNGFLHNFTSYAELNQGIVALLTGQSSPQSLSMRTVGMGLLAAVLITVSLDGWLLVHLWRHRDRWRYRSWGRLLLSSGSNLIPLVGLLALPYLIWPLLGRFASYDLLFIAQPDVLLWVTIIAGLGLIQAGIKLWLKVGYRD